MLWLSKESPYMNQDVFLQELWYWKFSIGNQSQMEYAKRYRVRRNIWYVKDPANEGIKNQPFIGTWILN